MGQKNSQHVSEFPQLDPVLRMLRQQSGYDDNTCLEGLGKHLVEGTPVMSLIGATGYVVNLAGYVVNNHILEMEKILQEKSLFKFNLSKLQMDFTFLHTLTLSLSYWRDENLAHRIPCLVTQIAHDLASAPATFQDRLDAVRNSQAKMCDLVLKFGHCVQVTEPKLMVGSFLQHWSEFVKSTQQCLMNLKMRFCVNDENAVLAPQMDSLHAILHLFLDFVTSIGEPFLLTHPSFTAHAISVIARVANQTCCCWFLTTDAVTAKAKITAILDLKDEISLANKKFFMLCLCSFRATNELEPPLEPELSRLSHLFLGYLLKSATSTTMNDLFEELLPLVSLVIKNEAGFPRKCLLGEIEDFLLWVAFLYQPLAVGWSLDAFLRSEVLIKVCLLRAEILVRELLQDGSRLSMLRLNADKLKRITATSPSRERALEFTDMVTQDIQPLYAYLVAENATKLSLRNSALVILIRIVYFKAEYFCMNLRDDPNLEDRQIKNFHEGLDLFTAIVNNLQLELLDDVSSILADAEEVCRSITSFSYSYIAAKKRGEVVTNMKKLLVDYLRKMNLVLSGLSPICLEFNVPMINEVRLVDLLLVNLRDSPIHDPTVKRFVEEIQFTLQSWRPFLTTALYSEASKNLELYSISKQATVVVYKVEYVVDLIRIDGVWKHAWRLYNIVQEMRLIDRQIPAIEATRQSLHNISRVSPRISSSEEKEVVSREDQERDIINELKE